MLVIASHWFKNVSSKSFLRQFTRSGLNDPSESGTLTVICHAVSQSNPFVPWSTGRYCHPRSDQLVLLLHIPVLTFVITVMYWIVDLNRTLAVTKIWLQWLILMALCFSAYFIVYWNVFAVSDKINRWIVLTFVNQTPSVLDAVCWTTREGIQCVCKAHSNSRRGCRLRDLLGTWSDIE